MTFFYYLSRSSLPLYWLKEKKSSSVVCILTGIIIIAAAIILVIYHVRPAPPITTSLATIEGAVNINVSQKTEICSTPQCVQESIKILSAINFSVDPCDDFYDFACGNFVNTTQIPDHKNEVDTITENVDEVQLDLKNILEDTNRLVNEPESLVLPRVFYKTCLNETKIEEDGIQPFLDQLELFGSWPVLKGDEWNSSWDLLDTIGVMRKVGYPTSYIVSATVTTLNVAFRRLYVSENFISLLFAI